MGYQERINASEIYCENVVLKYDIIFVVLVESLYLMQCDVMLFRMNILIFINLFSHNMSNKPVNLTEFVDILILSFSLFICLLQV